MIKKNTPELWDKFWKQSSLEEDLFDIKREENSVRWRKIEKFVLKKFGSFKGLKVIEIGAGKGTNALLFSLRGAEVSVLDYSKKALEQSEIFFKRHKLKVNLILQDALNLDKKLENKFDVSMSFGLAEHFQGKERKQIIKVHFEVLKKKGLTFISVPNKLNPPYQMNKFLSQLTGFWNVGEEYPFSPRELTNLADSFGKKSSLIGDSFISSFNFVNPLKILKRLFSKKKFDLESIKKERGCFLDNRFSYALVLVGENS